MEIIYEGWIKNQANSQKEKVKIKPLDQSYVAQLIKLQALVVTKLEDKPSYYPLSAEEIAVALTPAHGLVLGAFVNRKLIGFRVITYPGTNDDNLGMDIGLSTQELNQVVHLEAVCIHPDYRGNAMQRIMTKLVLKQLGRSGARRYIFLTISPNNLPSIKNTLANQLFIARLSYKYNLIQSK